MRTAKDLAYEELKKAELKQVDNSAELLVQKAHVLALLAIAEELARTNDREFAKVVVYNR